MSELPRGWKEGQIKDLIQKLDAGVSVNSEDDGNVNAEFKILKTSCVSSGVFIKTETKSVTDEKEVMRLKEPLLSDSIIISRMNTPVLVGANGYVQHGMSNTFLPDRLWQVKGINNAVNMRWLGFWFSSIHARYMLSSCATGTSGSMKNITKADVFSLKIKIPPLPEQRKIAQILSTWDKAIATTEKQIANSKQQKKALMQQLLTGKKRLAGFSGDWEVVKLSQVAKISIGLVTTMTKHYVESGVPLIRNSDIKPNEIKKDKMIFLSDSFATENEHRKLKLKDIVTVHTGDVGVSAVIDKSMVGSLGFATLNTRPVLKKIHPEYLCWFFNSHNFIHWCISMSTGDGRQNLNLKDFVKARIPLPPLKEQQKIAQVLTTADNEISTLETQLTHLKQEKKALMQQLLTGKRRVKI